MDTLQVKLCCKCGSNTAHKISEIGNHLAEISISEGTELFLQKTYFKHLCFDCINHFENLVQHSNGLVFPTRKELFVQNLHYYLENNYWVFTELFHLLRSKCCNNSCRHCIYGFKKKS